MDQTNMNDLFLCLYRPLTRHIHLRLEEGYRREDQDLAIWFDRLSASRLLDQLAEDTR
jgi:hypothetical protein